WGTILVTVGALLQLKTLDILDFNFFSLIIPIALIGAGLSVLISSHNRTKVDHSSKDADDISVIFTGSETKHKSNDYKGGKVTSIFGGASIDLRDAEIVEEASLDMFVMCGGVELKVPRDWKVITQVAPIAGGVENKS